MNFENVEHINLKVQKRRLADAAGRRRWLKKVDKLKEEGRWND